MQKYNTKPIWLSLLIVFLMPAASFCSEPNSSSPPPNSAQVTFAFKYDVNVPGHTSKVRLIVALPKNIAGRQKIIGIRYSPQPSSVLEENGIRYAEFFISKPPKHFTVEMTIKAEVYEYDLTTARAKNPRNLFRGPDFVQYLKSERLIEKDDPLIQQSADKITAKDELHTVKAIYDYVIDNMTYVPTRENLGAAAAIKSKQGDCAEYAALFVALCRAKQIPARVAVGNVTPWSISPKHAWVEVYLKEYGWVPFDPTLTFKDNTKLRNSLFAHLRRIYLYSGYRIEGESGKKAKHSFCSWLYWGDAITVDDSFEIKTVSLTDRPTAQASK